MAKPSKCCICSCQSVHDILEYNRKKYCHTCFEEAYEPEIVDKHYCYLTFQRIIGRKPTTAEWTQMNKLVAKDTKCDSVWTWQKVEYALEYVYEIERVEFQEEYGVIGILPYYESRMMRFRNECFDVEDDIADYGFGMETPETIVVKPKKNMPKYEIKRIDIDWSEDEWQDE